MNAGSANLMKWALGLTYFGLALLPLLFVPAWLQLALLLILLLFSAWNFWTMEEAAGREQDLRPFTRWEMDGQAGFRARLDEAARNMRLRPPVWAVEERDEVFRYSLAGPRGLVVFSSGLLRRTPPDEILALAGHELYRLRALDYLPVLVGTSWLGMLGSIALFLSRSAQTEVPTTAGYHVEARHRGGTIWQGLALVMGTGVELVATVVGWVAEYFLASRARYEEHLADLAGARLTSGPTMANALVRLKSFSTPRAVSAPRWSPEWLAQRTSAPDTAVERRIAALQRAAERGKIGA